MLNEQRGDGRKGGGGGVVSRKSYYMANFLQFSRSLFWSTNRLTVVTPRDIYRHDESEWCFQSHFCTVKLTGLGTTLTNEIVLV